MDVFRLFSEKIIKQQTPEAELICLKYFTADIKAKLATNGQSAQKSQNDYHRALSQIHENKIEIIKGYHTVEYATLPAYKTPPDRADKVDVWKLEEKQTDVNIALQLYRDAIQGKAEQLIIVSNDTDLEPPLKLIREDLGSNIQIGIVIPINKPQTKKHRPPNQRLSIHADWTRKYILDEELADCQLPDKIPTKKKPILKPSYW